MAKSGKLSDYALMFANLGDQRFRIFVERVPILSTVFKHKIKKT
jgi:hypothetical protein